MPTGLQARFASSDVPINVVEAVARALQKVQPAAAGMVYKNYLERTRQKVKRLRPNLQLTKTIYHEPVEQLQPIAYETNKAKAHRIRRELLDAGITSYGLMKSESRFLPKVIHLDEHVEAIVYGQHKSSSAMLVATDARIIFLDKKPMALFLDEVSYEVVSGIEFEIHTIFATLILHTPVKNYDIRFANLRCAANFARHIEHEKLKRVKTKEDTPAAGPRKYLHLEELKSNLAGYYWLPTKEDEEEVRKA